MDWSIPPPINRRSRPLGGVGLGQMVFFYVIPTLIGVWLTNRTARLVDQMWAEDHPADLAPATPPEVDLGAAGRPSNPQAAAEVPAPPPHLPNAADRSASDPTALDPAALDALLVEYQEGVLAQLSAIGPPGTWLARWGVDPVDHAEELRDLREVAPEIYRRWVQSGSQAPADEP